MRMSLRKNLIMLFLFCCPSLFRSGRCFFALQLDNLQTSFQIQICGNHIFRDFIVTSFIRDIWSVSSVQYFQFRFFGELLDVAFGLCGSLLCDKFDGFFKRNGHRIECLRQRYVFTVMAYVRSKASCTYAYFFILVFANDTRKFKQVQCFLKSDRFH